jgi:hypothetical protein
LLRLAGHFAIATFAISSFIDTLFAIDYYISTPARRLSPCCQRHAAVAMPLQDAALPLLLLFCLAIFSLDTPFSH